MKRPSRRPDRASKSRRDLRLEPLESRQLLTTFTVTSDASTGLNTLAAAILLSDADVAQPNRIEFDIPGTGPQTIALTTPLPTITQAVTIDATTQPGYMADTGAGGDNEVPAIILDGEAAGPGAGLVVASTATFSAIDGLQIERFDGDGVDVQADDSTVINDLIGVAPGGSSSPDLGNQGDGVSFEGASDAQVDGSVVGANRDYGILLESSPGAFLSSVTVTDTVALGLNPGDGVRVDGSDGATLSGVTTVGNAGIGINVSGSGGLDVANSTSQSNGGGGIAVSDSTSGSTITATTVGGTMLLGNSVIGVLDSDAPGLALSDDLITANDGPGLEVDAGSAVSTTAPSITSATITGNAGDGLDVNAATGLTLMSSSIEANEGDGINLMNGSTSATIQGTTIGGTASGQADGGIGLLVLGSDLASISGTIVEGNAGFGVELMRSDFATLTGVTVGGTTVLGHDLGDGILAVLSRSLVLTDPTINANAGIGINVDQSASASVQGATVTANSGGGVDLYESGSATISGTTVGGTTSTMGNGTVGILVAGSTIASLTGDDVEENQGNGVRIAFGSTSALVSNGTVSDNAGSGIIVSSPMPTITGTQVDGNQQIGIELYYSVAGSITSSGVGNLAANDGDGIDVLNSDGVTIGGTSAGTGNQVSKNLGSGIFVENSGQATIAYNTVDSAGGDGIVAGGDVGIILDHETVNQAYGIGVTLYEDSSNAMVTNLTISGSGGVGLLVNTSPGLLLTGGNFHDNEGSGAEVFGSDGIGIGATNFDNNPGFGLQIGDSANVTIGGALGPVEASGTSNPNSGDGRQGEGIELIDMTNVTVSDFTSTANGGPGLMVLGGTGGMISATTLGGTTASLGNGGQGLLVQNANELTVGAMAGPVVVENNAGNGIELDNSPATTLTGDTIEANQSDGVNLQESIGLSLTGSTIEYQSGHGLVVADGSDNATLSGNTISGDTGQDIVVTDSTNFVNND